MILPDETVLASDYPMYTSYWYLLDGKPYRYFGPRTTVDDFQKLKEQPDGSVPEVRRCSAIKRGLL